MNQIYAIATVGPEDHPVNLGVVIVRQSDTPGFFIVKAILNKDKDGDKEISVHQNKLRIAWKPVV